MTAKPGKVQSQGVAGISGSGALVMVGFDVVSEDGTTELALESIETHHPIPTTA